MSLLACCCRTMLVVQPESSSPFSSTVPLLVLLMHSFNTDIRDESTVGSRQPVSLLGFGQLLLLFPKLLEEPLGCGGVNWGIRVRCIGSGTHDENSFLLVGGMFLPWRVSWVATRVTIAVSVICFINLRNSVLNCFLFPLKLVSLGLVVFLAYLHSPPWNFPQMGHQDFLCFLGVDSSACWLEAFCLLLL